MLKFENASQMINFEIFTGQRVPSFIFNGQKISVAALTYSYKTADETYPSDLIIIVDGYFPDNPSEMRWVINLVADTIELHDMAEIAEITTVSRRFEILRGSTWCESHYDHIQTNDVIRVIDNGRVYADINGVSVWIVVGREDDGTLQIVEAVRKEDINV